MSRWANSCRKIEVHPIGLDQAQAQPIGRLEHDTVRVPLDLHGEPSDGVLEVVTDGKVIAEGTPGELKNSIGSGVLRVRLREPEARSEAERILSHTLGVAVETPSEPVALVARVSEPHRVSQALAELSRAGITTTDFALGQPSLDEVFLALTGHPAEEGTDMIEEKTA